MSAHDEDRIKNLLRQALPPIEAKTEPALDLWPAMLRRLDTKSTAQPGSRWVWFDWALAAGLAVIAVSFPASIPLLLYYL
ncbi:MAG: hypothetical protein WA802_00130 [Terracidiphilus sp.]